MSLRRFFQRRTGRIIASSRVFLAAVFIAAIWLDPHQPALAPTASYVILVAYLALSIAHAAFTWRDWWWEFRSARPMHLLDMALFGALVFLTEGYTSPYFIFSSFILLSAAVKWGWRETLFASLAVIFIYLLGGAGALLFGSGTFELQRFLIRGGHLGALAWLIVWFSYNQAKASPHKLFPLAIRQKEQEPFELALQLAWSATGAQRAIILWWENEEPWIYASGIEKAKITPSVRYAPDQFEEIVHPRLNKHTFLFDLSRHCAVVLEGARLRTLSLEGTLSGNLADEYNLRSGLAVFFEAGGRSGIVILVDVPGLCADDIALGERLGSRIGDIFTNAASVDASEQAAQARTRLSLASDLHDGVAQLLAGTAFRLEAIRKVVAAVPSAESQIDELQMELSAHQKELRHFIAELRGNVRFRGRVDLCSGLRPLMNRISRQWGVDCFLGNECAGIEVPAAVEHDVHQLVRESVANAVRHGGARCISISVTTDEEVVQLEVSDDGKGFQQDAVSRQIPSPWSLSERVRSLGGSLSVASSSRGTRVSIALPRGAGK